MTTTHIYQIHETANELSVSPESLADFKTRVEASVNALQNPESEITVKGFISGLLKVAKESWREPPHTRNIGSSKRTK